MPSGTYLITGAASGMGLATASLLLSQGSRVALTDIDPNKLQQATSSLPASHQSQTITIPLDVTDRSAVRAALAKTRSHFGTLSGVANFAGTGGHHLGTQPVWETSDDEFDFITELNVRGCFNVVAESLKPSVLDGGDGNGGASIVHVASQFALQGFANGAVFAASKHASLGMIRSAAKEAGGRVRVNCVLPGAIDTPMHRANLERVPGFADALQTPIPRPGDASEVAHVVAFLLGEEASFVTGAAWSVDGGASAF